MKQRVHNVMKARDCDILSLDKKKNTETIAVNEKF